MSGNNHKLVVAVVTQHEAKVWADGIEPGTAPHVVHAPGDQDHRHVRTGQADHGHHVDSANPDFFAAIAAACAGAGHLLLIGHGHGKGSEVDRFRDYLGTKHRDLSAAVSDDLHLNLQAMSDGEILKAAREWWAKASQAGRND
jgi:hypothetical protein